MSLLNYITGAKSGNPSVSNVIFFRSLTLTMNDIKMTSTSTFTDVKDEPFMLALLSKLRQQKHMKPRRLPAGHRNTDLSLELKTFCVEITPEIRLLGDSFIIILSKDKHFQSSRVA